MNVNQPSAVDIISNCIVNCMKPLLFVEYCYGIFRYRLDKRSSDAINLRMKIISIVISSVWITSFVYGLSHAKITFSNTVVIAYYLVSFLIVIAYASSTIMLVLWQSQNNRKVIEIFAGIDISLHVNIDQKIYNMFSRQCKILFTMYMSYCVICIAMYSYFSTYDNRITYLFFLFIHFERKIELYVFCLFLYMIKQRVLLINNYLSKITGDQGNVLFRQHNVNQLDIVFIGNISNTNYKVRHLASAYCKVGKVTILINKIYNSLILMTLVTAFIFIIIALWTILYSFKVNYVISSLSMLFYTFSELFSVIFISYYCESITVVNGNLKNTLYRILNRTDLPIFMKKQVNVFVKLTKVWRLTINVFDMFDVSSILVLHFISICTSYLIVLIQIYRLI